MYLVLNNKSPFYQLVYLREGKRTTISTGTKDKTQAENFLNTFSIPLIPITPKVTQTKKILLSSFIFEYKNYVKKTYSIKYYKKAVVTSFNILQKFIPDMHLENITPKILDQFISSKASTSIYAASLYYRTLKAAFNKAVVWDYIKDNPFNKLKAPKVTKSFPVFISQVEYELILNSSINPKLNDLFSFAFYTGMRLAEILNLKWSSVNLNDKLITIKNTDTFTTKNKKERIIPINQKLFPILSNRLPKVFNLKDDNYIFSKNGIKYNEDFISKQFKKSVRAAELNDKIHFHSLRHSFASNLVQKGVSLYVVKELLGHEDIKTTQIYSHLQQENLSKAVNLL